ncbi:MAG: GDP-mannose 4,6-dehydratase, partial [Bacteroidota bacterium]
RPSIQAPEAYIDTNIHGTNNILEWMRRQQMTKLLFASSSSVYGNQAAIPFREDATMDEPISPYAFTKRACELATHTYHHLYGFDVINARFFTVYGPRQRPDLAIHKFVKLISSGQSIQMFGDGSTARDYTFVADTIDGVMKAAAYLLENNPVYTTVNLGNHTPVKLKALIEGIGEALGIAPQVEQLPMQDGDVDITYADITRAQELFGYDPKTNIRDGLSRFVAWFRKQHQA